MDISEGTVKIPPLKSCVGEMRCLNEYWLYATSPDPILRIEACLYEFSHIVSTALIAGLSPRFDRAVFVASTNARPLGYSFSAE